MVDLALRDIDRFKRQKVRDLKDVFINYAILQTEKYKKVGGHTLLRYVADNIESLERTLRQIGWGNWILWQEQAVPWPHSLRNMKVLTLYTTAVSSGLGTNREFFFNEMSISFNQLSISFNQLSISFNQLSISVNQLSISFNQLSISFNQLSISFNQFSIFCSQLSFSVN